MKNGGAQSEDGGDALPPRPRKVEPGRLRIAYLVNQYPKVSHTFIRREIGALENCGLEIERFSLRASNEHLVEEADQAELRRTQIVLEQGLIRVALAMLMACLSRPLRFVGALKLTLRIGWRSDRGLLRNLAYLAEASVLLGWFERKDINHVHAHFGTNSAGVAMLCHVLGGPPYTFTVHGPDEFDRARYLALDKKIARARFVVTVSSFGRSQLYRTCDPCQWSKIHVVHPGIDDALLCHSPAPLPSEPRIVCVGRLHKDKGQLLLIEAVRQLIFEGVACELALVGDGPLRTEIEARIAHLHLDRHILLTGPVSLAELCRQVQAARVVVLPSLAENLPSVIMEAFALGRPVIATAVGGIPELVKPGTCGWLIPPGSVEALAGAIGEALAAPTEGLERMAREGARRVREQFRSITAAERLMRLFQASEF